jgi:DNA-binding NtrC family response regulator
MKGNMLIDGVGIDILQEVTRTRLESRVIIMMAYPSAETAQDSFRLHAVDDLIKSPRRGDLINSVNEALEQ